MSRPISAKATWPLKALALEGASFLRQILERGEHKIIGVGHGRTLAAVVEQLPRTPARDLQFVSLLGGLTRKFAANPFDVIHRLAERTGAEAYLLPVPVFANSVADRAVLMQQYGLAEVFAPGAARHPGCSWASARSTAMASWSRAE